MPDTAVHKGFAPIVDGESKILILGTLPGPASLRSGEYYKGAGNAFWRILFALAELPYSPDYALKRRVLLSRRLALWDVFAAAEREGAADANIRKAAVNDFRTLFREYPDLRGIVFNGRTAEKAFPVKLEVCKTMPRATAWSTSGACARRFEDKLDNWRSAIHSLGIPDVRFPADRAHTAGR